MAADGGSSRYAKAVAERGSGEDLTVHVSRLLTLESCEEVCSGSRVSRYVILERIGKGGMGVVYKAYDPELDRAVALKLVKPDGDSDESRESSGEESRLQREAQALARLAHPNVVAVYDVGPCGRGVFVTMELVEGQTLKKWLTRSEHRPDEIIQVITSAGRGLAAAHEAGLVHRDFKPGNVIIGNDGRVRVIDFGLARHGANSEPGLDEQPAEPEPETSAEPDTGISCDNDSVDEESSISSRESLSSSGLLDRPLTQAGSLVGTPLYMAPEQYALGAVDARADQFAFCVVLYEALFGRHPFPHRGRRGRVKRLKWEPQVPPRSSRATGWVADVLLRGLAEDPAQRYASMERLLNDLARDPEAARIRQQQARRRMLAVGCTVALVAVAPFGLWYGYRASQKNRCENGSQQLAGIWDAQTMRAIERSFLATDKPYAADAWRGVERLLDRYTSQWRGFEAEVCLAEEALGGDPENLAQLKRSCLAEARSHLRALSLVFKSADDGVVQKAVHAAFDLPSIDRCSNTAALITRRELVGSAANSAKGGLTESIRSQLAAAEAHFQTSQHTEGLRIAQATLDSARGAGSGPLLAEALFWSGQMLRRLGDYEKAQQNLEESFFAAVESGHEEVQVKAATLLLRVVGYRRHRHQEGLRWGRHAQALIERSFPNGVLEARCASELGVLRDNVGEFEQAVASYHRALEIWERTLQPNDPEMGSTLNNLGVAYYWHGDLKQALGFYRRALVIFEKGLGRGHPHVSIGLSNIGLVLRDQGEYQQAKDYFERAFRTGKAAFGASHPDLAWSVAGLASVFSVLGHQQAAQLHYERAAELCRQGLCAADLVPQIHFGLAQLLWASQDDRPRSLRLAQLAQKAYQGQVRSRDKDRAAVDAWLAERRPQ